MRKKKADIKLLAKRIIALTIAGVLLTGCSSKTQTKTEQDSDDTSLSVIVATDIHYLSPTLTDHGEIFTKAMAAGDGKYTAYCEEITDAFLEEVKEAEPDALILSGDLTFNGEENSHKEMAEKLSAVQKAGIPVLVLPGNHEIRSES